MKFAEMNLPDFIKRALGEQGFVDATEIQERTMPLIESGIDVIGLSQTGSGKTYAYGIPAINCVDVNLSTTQVLVICPTRELVTQVVDHLNKLLTQETHIRVTPIYGGANIDRQTQSLKRGAKIVVGTPGRLMDHLRRKTLRLDYLKMLVLDEADEMLQMGFKQDIETILKSTKPEHQTIMFSATMPPEIKKLTSAFMRDPVTIKSKNHECSHALIKQYFVNCKKTEKIDMLARIHKIMYPFISIVFCNTKRMTEDLVDALKKEDLPAVYLHGDMRQRERSRTMDNFKKHGGILIATDVAARGIDVKNIDIVVNFDFPNNEEYYTHRIGRTGRAGKTGTAFTIINTIQQAKALQDLTRKLGGTAEEYATLSTTQFLANEPNKPKQRRNSSRKPQGNSQQRYGQQRNRRDSRQSESTPSHKPQSQRKEFKKPQGNRYNREDRPQHQRNRNKKRP